MGSNAAVPDVQSFEVTASGLGGLLAALGLEPAGCSPLRGFVATDAGEDQPGEWPAAIAPELRSAMEVLCRPETLVQLVDATQASAMRLAMFLAAERAVALRRAEDGTLHVAAPVGRASLAALLVDLVATKDADGAPAHSIPDTVLAALGCCVAAGVGDERSVAEPDVCAALAELGLDATAAASTVQALIDDELLALSGDGGLRLGAASEPFRAALALEARLTLSARPVAEAAREAVGDVRELIFAGPYGRRLLVQDDLETEEPATLLGPVTHAEADTLIADLLGGAELAGEDGASWTLTSAEDAAGEGVLGERPALTVSGRELLAITDVLAGEAGPLPDDEPADELQREVRIALSDGLAEIRGRGLIVGEPPVLADDVRGAFEAWLTPTLVVSVERTRSDGTDEIRCSVAGDLVAIDCAPDGFGGTVRLGSSATLVDDAVRLTGLDRATSGHDTATITLNDGDDPFLDRPDLALVRVAVRRTDGEAVVGEDLTFAHARSGGCWLIEEPAVDLETAPNGVQIRLVPTEPSELRRALADSIPTDRLGSSAQADDLDPDRSPI